MGNLPSEVPRDKTQPLPSPGAMILMPPSKERSSAVDCWTKSQGVKGKAHVQQLQLHGEISTAGLHGVVSKSGINLSKFSGGWSCWEPAAVPPCSRRFAIQLQQEAMGLLRVRCLCSEGLGAGGACDFGLCSLVSDSQAIPNTSQQSLFPYLQWKCTWFIQVISQRSCLLR